MQTGSQECRLNLLRELMGTCREFPLSILIACQQKLYNTYAAVMETGYLILAKLVPVIWGTSSFYLLNFQNHVDLKLLTWFWTWWPINCCLRTVQVQLGDQAVCLNAPLLFRDAIKTFRQFYLNLNQKLTLNSIQNFSIFISGIKRRNVMVCSKKINCCKRQMMLMYCLCDLIWFAVTKRRGVLLKK